MEKYARQAVSEGVKSAEELHVAADSEIYRVLNLHYNRNNHIEVCGPQVRYNLPQTPPNSPPSRTQPLEERWSNKHTLKDLSQLVVV